MFVYLGGPYTSDSLRSHQIHIGRFLAYKVFLEIDQRTYHPKTGLTFPVICYPLETAGFHVPLRLSRINWLERACKLLENTQYAYFTPGSFQSSGCQIEMDLLSQKLIFWKILPKLDNSQNRMVYSELKQASLFNPLVSWATHYLEMCNLYSDFQ